MSILRMAGITAALLSACACSDALAGSEAGGFVSEDIGFESRGTDVPATLVLPATAGTAPFPIVVLAHGHGGTRDEAGGFRRLAEALARRGIASIRPDFPGCGQSKEPFTRNNLSNMLADSRAALAHARLKPGIDPERAGVVGYSMGARVAMLMLPEGYAAAVLWAPVGLDGPDAIFPLFGGPSGYAELRERALDSGSTAFVTPWGQQQQLGRRWFDDLETYRPMSAVRSFTGALLVISGADDSLIEPGIALAVAEAASGSDHVRVEILDGADHGLGFFDDDAATSERVIEATADFLVSNLFRSH